jgi:FkbM family methyltransferase
MNYGPASPAETGELAVIDRLAREQRDHRPVVFDVGANVGDYATAVLERFLDVELHCFEPSPGAFARLHQRIGSNRASPSLHPFGLGACDVTVPFYADAPGSGLGSVYSRRLDHYGIPFDRQYDVRLRRLDDVAAELSIGGIDLLKLDVEGHEVAVLEGARETLERRVIAAIQFEFGGANIDARTFFQDLWYVLSPHYRIYRIVRDGLVELPEYRDAYEIFVTANYLCLLREGE